MTEAMAEAEYDAARRAYVLAFRRLKKAKAAFECVQWQKVADVLAAGPIAPDFYNRCREAGVRQLGHKDASNSECLRLVDRFIAAYLPGWRMDTTQSLADNSAEAVRLALERYHAREQAA